MKLVFLLTLGICAQAASPATAPAKAPKATPSLEVSQAKVDHWTQTWRKRLSLDDWDITTVMVRLSELKPDTLGNLHWNSGTKTATIRVLDPADYDLPPTEVPADIEYTVVHELVHLQLAALPRDPNSKSIEEKVVNGIAEALLSLERGPGYRPRTAVAHLATKDRSTSEASRSSKP